jgi:hypothetical protein
MTKQDRHKLNFLIALLVVLGVTLYIAYGRTQAPDPAVVQAEAQKKAAAAASSDARIRLDLLDQSRVGEPGKSNLFQYRSSQTPASPAPASPEAAIPAPSPPVRPANPPPPPPPPIPLKYVGFGYIEPNSKALIATLFDDTLQKHFNAVEGEVWVGRYRILRITNTSVEVEDLEYNRRQTFALSKQP